MRPQYLRLQSGVTERIVLATEGVLKQGLYGMEFFYQLQDGRFMYLPESVGKKIVTAKIEPGQAFWLLKHKGISGRKTVWDLYTEDPTAPTALETQLQKSIEAANARKLSQPNGPVPVTHEAPASSRDGERLTVLPSPKPVQSEWSSILIRETNTLSDCYAEALKHAHDSHNGLVKPEDVRTLMITAFINRSQKARRTA